MRLEKILAFYTIMVKSVPLVASKSLRALDFSRFLQFLTIFYRGTPILDCRVDEIAFWSCY